MQLYPNHLNLNGDGANALILTQRAKWSGLQSSLQLLNPGEVPNDRPDVLVIGHGSTAAWKQIYGEFARLVPVIADWMEKGTQVVAVSSGFAALHGLLPGLASSIERGDRVSIFVVEEFEGEQVYGYRNSDLVLPNIVRHENLIGTMLHGPLLAKSSWLADAIISTVAHGVSRSEIEVAKLDEVEALAIAARKLAAEQAND
jgi:CobQ-like glutamine amidotransferase family enzyme